MVAVFMGGASWVQDSSKGWCGWRQHNECCVCWSTDRLDHMEDAVGMLVAERAGRSCLVIKGPAPHPDPLPGVTGRGRLLFAVGGLWRRRERNAQRFDVGFRDIASACLQHCHEVINLFW